MATQTLEFNCTPGLEITAKLFDYGTDIQRALALATEKTNHTGRYSIELGDIPAGEYLLVGYVSGVAGFVNERYRLALVTDTYYPVSETLFWTYRTTPSHAIRQF